MPQTRAEKLAYHRAYFESHREIFRARGTAWRHSTAGKEYMREYQRRRRAALPLPVLREEQKRENLLANYDITLEEYNVMLAKHNGGCWICGKKPPFGRIKYLCVDHDHETGKIRGLLCNCCNTFLGRIHDDPMKVFNYLNKISKKKEQ